MITENSDVIYATVVYIHKTFILYASDIHIQFFSLRFQILYLNNIVKNIPISTMIKYNTSSIKVNEYIRLRILNYR